MHTHHLLQLVPNRVAATVDRLRRQIWTRVSPVRVEATGSAPDHLTWAQAMSKSRSSVSIGSAWGRLFDQRWCRLDLPHAANGGESQNQPLYLEWRDQAEATLYIGGVPHFGFDVAHRYSPLPAGLRSSSIRLRSGPEI